MNLVEGLGDVLSYLQICGPHVLSKILRLHIAMPILLFLVLFYYTGVEPFAFTVL
jgi:hypothetical protein